MRWCAKAPTCSTILWCSGSPPTSIRATYGRRWSGASGSWELPRNFRRSVPTLHCGAKSSRSIAVGSASGADRPFDRPESALRSFPRKTVSSKLRLRRLWRMDTSVAGGVLGYFIGAVLYDSIGLWLIQLYGYGDKVDAFRAAYAQWGGWIILIKGFTPIPYKIVTIASGFAGYNFLLFVILSIITRGMRFYVEAFLLNRYGAQARAILEERLEVWATAFAVVLVAGIFAALYLF